MGNRDRYFAFRLNGVTAAFEVRDEQNDCLLRSMTNCRPLRVGVFLRLRGGQAERFILQPFQKLDVYPPLVMNGGPRDVRNDCAIGWQDDEVVGACLQGDPRI
jgi:hypothetical protein